MRKFALFAILSFVFSGLAIAQSKCSQFGAGEMKNGTFTNPLIGISYSVPANLKAQDVSSVPKATNASQGMYLLLLWREPQTVDKPNVIFMAEDPSVYNDSTALGYAKRIERTATQQWKATMLEPIREFDLNGVKFYRVDYRFPDQGLSSILPLPVKSRDVSFPSTCLALVHRKSMSTRP